MDKSKKSRDQLMASKSFSLVDKENIKTFFSKYSSFRKFSFYGISKQTRDDENSGFHVKILARQSFIFALKKKKKMAENKTRTENKQKRKKTPKNRKQSKNGIHSEENWTQ